MDRLSYPYDCWFIFKTKEFNHVGCRQILLPSPMDKEGIEGIHPDDVELLEEDQQKYW
jgi:hypothetical protein